MSVSALNRIYTNLKNISHTDSIKLRGRDCTDNSDGVEGGGGEDKQQQHHQQNSPVNSDVVGHHGKATGGETMSGAVPPPATTTSAAAAVEMTSAGPQQQPLHDLHREDVRLTTFDNDQWDVPFLNKGKLAQIGFFYMGTQDAVKCYFCKVEIGKWEPDDDVFTEHMRWSPSCPLLRRHQTDNVPIDAEELNQILPPITYDTCGANGGGVIIRRHAYAERSFTPTADSHEQLSVRSASSRPSSTESGHEEMNVSSGAVSPVVGGGSGAPAAAAPLFATSASASATTFMPPQMHPYMNMVATPHLEIEANRLKTFKEWPIQLKMKPVELSDAGFFYTGLGDRVQCFSCGGGLKNWEDDDRAWEQHALWYGNCEYLKLIKGQRYVDEVKEKYRRREEEEAAEDEEGEGEPQPALSSGDARLDEPVVSTDEDEEQRSGRTGTRADQDRDTLPSTSTTRAREAAASRRRRRTPKGCDSHPESQLNSREAMQAAKSAKQSEVPETKLCKICYECEFNTAFIPCGHVVACAKCASAVTTCPMCREPFESVTRIYFS